MSMFEYKERELIALTRAMLDSIDRLEIDNDKLNSIYELLLAASDIYMKAMADRVRSCIRDSSNDMSDALALIVNDATI
jgi:hypothetical protein